MATRLKNMQLTSVDLVRAGANQEADICLFKSADPQEASDSPTEHEQNIFKRFIDWLRSGHQEPEFEADSPIEKADDDQPDPTDIYKSAITESIQSIVADDNLSPEEKNDMIEKSIGQYHEAMLGLLMVEEEDIEKADDEEEDADEWTESDEEDEEDDYDVIEEVEKFNQNHGTDGRFVSSGGGGGGNSKQDTFRQAHENWKRKQAERQATAAARQSKKPKQGKGSKAVNEWRNELMHSKRSFEETLDRASNDRRLTSKEFRDLQDAANRFLYDNEDWSDIF